MASCSPSLVRRHRPSVSAARALSSTTPYATKARSASSHQPPFTHSLVLSIARNSPSALFLASFLASGVAVGLAEESQHAALSPLLKTVRKRECQISYDVLKCDGARLAAVCATVAIIVILGGLLALGISYVRVRRRARRAVGVSLVKSAASEADRLVDQDGFWDAYEDGEKAGVV